MEAVDVSENGGAARGNVVVGKEYVEIAERVVDALGGLEALVVGEKSGLILRLRPSALLVKTNAERVQVTFVPLGIVVDGKTTRPEVKSPVHIGKISLVVEKAKEAK